MRYGVIITGGPAREQVELAREAEAAGWDGVFTWDGIHVSDDIETYDPWALLGAMAMVTERVTLGAIISPLSRRRPWKVARETTTIDRLSNGRLVLPVGLGAAGDRGISGMGEAATRLERAERLDEALEILTGLWSGEPFGYAGRHHAFEPMAFSPTPVRRQIPIWVVGAWPSERSMARVLRHDGWLPYWLPKAGDEGLLAQKPPTSSPPSATGSARAAPSTASTSSWRALRRVTIPRPPPARFSPGQTPARPGGSSRTGTPSNWNPLADASRPARRA